MQVNISGHHVEVTESMRTYVLEKMARLERHFDHVTQVQVILTVEKVERKAEAQLHVAGADVYAEAVNEDMYAAIDALADKLDRQVIKQKEKVKNHRAPGHRERILEDEGSVA
jgi:putative sigma-54 modulation protein